MSARSRHERVLALVRLGKRASEIAAIEGITSAGIRKIAAANRVPIKPQRPGPKPATYVLPLGPVHKKIASRLCAFRQNDPDLPDFEEAGERLRIGGKRLFLAELAGHDWRLSELIRLAEAMGVSLAELVG